MVTPQVWAGLEPHLCLRLQGPVGGKYLVLTGQGTEGGGALNWSPQAFLVVGLWDHPEIIIECWTLM